MTKRLWTAAIVWCAASCAARPEGVPPPDAYVAFEATEATLGNPSATSVTYTPVERLRRVTLGEFAMARRPVTVREFAAFLNSSFAQGRAGELVFTGPRFNGEIDNLVPTTTGFEVRPGRGDCPVTQATWLGAVEYCRWLTSLARDGHVYTLPTEWEWEFAARGCSGRSWPWGDQEPTQLHGWRWTARPWEVEQSGWLPAVGTHPAGTTPEGIEDLMGYGLFEMCANPFVADPGDVDGRGLPETPSFADRCENRQGPAARGSHTMDRGWLAGWRVLFTRSAGSRPARVWSRFDFRLPCEDGWTMFRVVRRKVPAARQ